MKKCSRVCFHVPELVLLHFELYSFETLDLNFLPRSESAQPPEVASTRTQLAASSVDHGDCPLLSTTQSEVLAGFTGILSQAWNLITESQGKEQRLYTFTRFVEQRLILQPPRGSDYIFAGFTGI